MSCRRFLSTQTLATKQSSNFYPRPPRGGRPERNFKIALMDEFLSTPSARRATTGGAGRKPTKSISIHALREEGDRDSETSGSRTTKFLSTPSARRATPQWSLNRLFIFISIHALREEGDPAASFGRCGASHFYPRPPRGGRPKRYVHLTDLEGFLSTPSARRATRIYRWCR